MIFGFKIRTPSDRVDNPRTGVLHLFFPVAISAAMIFGRSCLTINLVPLHNPRRESIFFRSIMIAPIFDFKICGGIPEIFNVLRNSIGKLAISSSSPVTVSMLLYVDCSPGIFFMMILFMFKQSSFLGHKIARLLISFATFSFKRFSGSPNTW